MKRLTINRVARANLKFHRKAYISLLTGIFLAVYLVSATGMCLWGMFQAREAQMARQVGWLDAILPDSPQVSDDQLRDSGLFELIGHVYVTASVQGGDVFAGYYDDTAADLLNRSCVAGRLPQAAGEIAAEQSALDKLGWTDAALGDTITWTMQPVDGTPEERTFSLVGLLNEQSIYLNRGFLQRVGSVTVTMPAVLTSPAEPAYAPGRLAVHRVMTTPPLVTLTQIQNYGGGVFSACCSVSRVSGECSYFDNREYESIYQLQQALLWGSLGAALLLAACVGIASAMENMLAQKTEDIGMLRAVGATRRQIRRLFGREAWLLAWMALPVGAGMGCLTCWLLSRLMPEQMLFHPTPWLLLPVLAVSFLCVLLSAALPLRRASRQLPMGVLRDTVTLRRIMHIRSTKSFHPARLIAGRQLRLHPLRQAGSTCMVTLMLLCATLLGVTLYSLYQHAPQPQEAFMLQQSNTSTAVEADAFSYLLDGHRLTAGDLAQIRDLPLVSKLKTATSVRINLLLPKGLPHYLQTPSIPIHNENGEIGVYSIYITQQDTRYILLDEGLTADALENEGYYDPQMQQLSLQMHALQQASGISDPMTPVTLLVLSLEAGELDKNVTEGKIDLEALDAGREVLVYAPNFCIKLHSDGYGAMSTQEYFDDELDPAQWDLILQNDYFYAGQTLPLLQVSGQLTDDFRYLSSDEAQLQAFYAAMDKVSVTPRVGAVLKGDFSFPGIYGGGISLITTEKGLQSLGLQTSGVDSAAIYLGGDPYPGTEASPEASLERIGLRRDMTLFNNLKSARDTKASLIRMGLLFTGMLTLFFAVAAAMQVSGASRRIQADQRMIGTLRAAGADEHTLMGCYRLPVFLSAGCGVLLAAAITAALLLGGTIPLPFAYLALALPAMLVLAALNVLCALAGIRARLRQIMGRSVVDNIREL